MSDIILKAEEIGKKYNLEQISYTNLRDEISARFLRKKPKKERGEEFWALKNISFELKKGEVLGIIGKNGSGKSTLLRILSQITAPSEGKIYYKGRIASILDIGTGFHPDLSGRENVFLRGELLSMPRKEIEKQLDEIIAFSGIGEFIENPVKHYSSGMFLRLAFSVSMFLRADILLLDEVISVGDAAFRLKCFSKLEEMVRSGVSIILVSHNFNEITSFCNRCIWLDHGTIKSKGEPLDVVQQYSNEAIGAFLGKESKHSSAQKIKLARAARTRYWTEEEDHDNGCFKLIKIAIEPVFEKGSETHYMKTPFSIMIEYQKLNPDSDIHFYFAIFHITGDPVLSVVNKNPEMNKGKEICQMKCDFPGNLLNHGDFYCSFWISSKDKDFVDAYQKMLYFSIECNPEDINTPWKEVHAHVRPDLVWLWNKKIEDA